MSDTEANKQILKRIQTEKQNINKFKDILINRIDVLPDKQIEDYIQIILNANDRANKHRHSLRKLLGKEKPPDVDTDELIQNIQREMVTNLSQDQERQVELMTIIGEILTGRQEKIDAAAIEAAQLKREKDAAARERAARETAAEETAARITAAEIVEQNTKNRITQEAIARTALAAEEEAAAEAKGRTEAIRPELEYCEPALTFPVDEDSACKVLNLTPDFKNQPNARTILNDAYSALTKTCVNTKSKYSDNNYELNIDTAYKLLTDVLYKEYVSLQKTTAAKAKQTAATKTEQSEKVNTDIARVCASLKNFPVDIDASLIALEIKDSNGVYYTDANFFTNTELANELLHKAFISKKNICINNNKHTYRDNLTQAYRLIQDKLTRQEELNAQAAAQAAAFQPIDAAAIIRQQEDDKAYQKHFIAEAAVKAREAAIEAALDLDLKAIVQAAEKREAELARLLKIENDKIDRLNKEAKNRSDKEVSDHENEQIKIAQWKKNKIEEDKQKITSMMTKLEEDLKKLNAKRRDLAIKAEAARAEAAPGTSGTGGPGPGGPGTGASGSGAPGPAPVPVPVPVPPLTPAQINALQEATLVAMRLFEIPFNKTFFKIITPYELTKKKQTLLKKLENNTLPVSTLVKLTNITKLAYDYLAIILENLSNIILGNSLNHLPLESLNTFYTKLDPAIITQLQTLLAGFVQQYKQLTFNESTIILRPKINQTRKDKSTAICNELGQLNPLINSLRGIPSQMRKLTRKVNLETIQKNIKMRINAKETQKAKEEEEAKQQTWTKIEAAEKTIEAKNSKRILERIDELSAEIADLAEPALNAPPTDKQLYLRTLNKNKGELANLKKALSPELNKKSKGGNSTRKTIYFKNKQTKRFRNLI